MTGIYVLLGLILLFLVVNTIILVGMGWFLLKIGVALRENRENNANAIEDIADMVRILRGNFEDLKTFIRSLVA